MYPQEISANIKSSDIKRMAYWIICKYKVDDFHHQSASAKRDQIGGFIDRWMNRAPEYLIFNKLLENKEYEVVRDNFLYNKSAKKNAPDVIGIKDENKIIGFTCFNDGSWEPILDMPYIEVKTFRDDHALITIDKEEIEKYNQYYVIVESHLTKDYITALFEESIFSDEIYNFMELNNDFIESDIGEYIIKPDKLARCEDLGTFKLLGIFKEEEIKKYAVKVGYTVKKEEKKKEKKIPIIPRYFNDVNDLFDVLKSNVVCLEDINEGEYHYKYLDIEYYPFDVQFVEKESKLILIKRNTNDMDVKVNGNIKLVDLSHRGNIIELNDGYFKIKFSKSNGKRNIATSTLISPYDFEEIEEGVYHYQNGDIKYVPFNIEFIENDSKLFILNKATTSLDVKVKGKVKFNDVVKEDGCFRIDFKTFKRSKTNIEYIIDKYVIKNIAEDITTDLINRLDGIWANTV